MKEFLADASVLLKWYLSEDEPHLEQALELRRQFVGATVRLEIPELALVELANRLCREKSNGEALFLGALELFQNPLPFSAETLAVAFHLARQERSRGHKQVTVHDAVYIAAALEHSLTLVTSDAVQYQAARRAGCPVMHIREWGQA